MLITWTREAAKSLSPTREGARAAPPKTVPEELRRKVLAAAWKPAAEKLRLGLALADAEIGALTERVLACGIARFTDRDVGPLDAELEGMVACALSWGALDPPTAELLSDWLAREGPAFMVRALAARGGYCLRYASAAGAFGMDYSRSSFERSRGDRYLFLARERDEFVRQAVVSADDAQYAEVVTAVGALRSLGGANFRAELAGLVPSERALARACAEELLGPAGGPAFVQSGDVLGPLLAAIDDVPLAERVMRSMRKPFELGSFAFDAVRAAQALALAPLAEYVESLVDDPPRANMGLSEARKAARALALFDDPRAAAAFAPWVGDTRALGPVAVEYFESHPARAFETLGARLLDKGKRAEPAQRILAALSRAQPDAVRAVTASLGDDVRAAVEALLASSHSTATDDDAPLEVMPLVLRAPPWRSKQPRPERPVLEGLVAPALPERVTWADEAERLRIIAAPVNYTVAAWSATRERELKKLAAAIEGGERPLSYDQRVLLPFNAMADDEAVRLFNETPLWTRDVAESSVWCEVPYMVARFGARIMPALPATAAERITGPTFRALLACESVRLVPVVLRGLARGATRRLAQQWLERHPATAAAGLVPMALAPAGRAKSDAADALRLLDAAGHRGTVLEAAAHHGDAARSATERLLDADPLADCPKSAPKLSAFVEPNALPPLLLTDGRRAAESAVRHLLEMLQFTPADPPYAGVAQVRGVFQPASLDALLRALLDAWIAAGGAAASAWVLRAIGHLGSDDLARELAACIRRWPREKAKPRALMGVDALGMMNSDLALMHLADLAKTAKNKDVEAAAAERLARAAAVRGLGPDDLDDRLTPTLDLARDGTGEIDFGPRSFRVAIDDQLALHLYGGGQRLASLPRATAKDNPELARAGKARWQSLRDDLDRVRASLFLRMELAMVRGRRWEPRAVDGLFARHPIASRVARRLLWGVFEGDGRGRLVDTFRITEDGTLADRGDCAFAPPPEDARVGIVHPLEFASDGDPLLATWRARFEDYQLDQPFAQLHRCLTRVAASDAGRYTLPVPGDREIPYRMLAGRLEARGYRRSAPDGDGVMNEYSRAMSESTVWVRFSPGHFVREAPPESVTVDVSFDDGRKLGDVNALDLSEAYIDLAPFDRADAGA